MILIIKYLAIRAVFMLGTSGFSRTTIDISRKSGYDVMDSNMVSNFAYLWILQTFTNGFEGLGYAIFALAATIFVLSPVAAGLSPTKDPGKPMSNAVRLSRNLI